MDLRATGFKIYHLHFLLFSSGYPQRSLPKEYRSRDGNGREWGGFHILRPCPVGQNLLPILASGQGRAGRVIPELN